MIAAIADVDAHRSIALILGALRTRDALFGSTVFPHGNSNLSEHLCVLPLARWLLVERLLLAQDSAHHFNGESGGGRDSIVTHAARSQSVYSRALFVTTQQREVVHLARSVFWAHAAARDLAADERCARIFSASHAA
jgi:hypothetical protein